MKKKDIEKLVQSAAASSLDIHFSTTRTVLKMGFIRNVAVVVQQNVKGSFYYPLFCRKEDP